MVNKHMRKCLTSLVIRENTKKITTEYHVTPATMAAIKYDLAVPLLGRCLVELKTHPQKILHRNARSSQKLEPKCVPTDNGQTQSIPI